MNSSQEIKASGNSSNPSLSTVDLVMRAAELYITPDDQVQIEAEQKLEAEINALRKSLNEKYNKKLNNLGNEREYFCYKYLSKLSSKLDSGEDVESDLNQLNSWYKNLGPFNKENYRELLQTRIIQIDRTLEAMPEEGQIYENQQVRQAKQKMSSELPYARYRNSCEKSFAHVFPADSSLLDAAKKKYEEDNANAKKTFEQEDSNAFLIINERKVTDSEKSFWASIHFKQAKEQNLVRYNQARHEIIEWYDQALGVISGRLKSGTPVTAIKKQLTEIFTSADLSKNSIKRKMITAFCIMVCAGEPVAEIVNPPSKTPLDQQETKQDDNSNDSKTEVLKSSETLDKKKLIESSSLAVIMSVSPIDQSQNQNNSKPLTNVDPHKAKILEDTTKLEPSFAKCDSIVINNLIAIIGKFEAQVKLLPATGANKKQLITIANTMKDSIRCDTYECDVKSIRGQLNLARPLINHRNNGLVRCFAAIANALICMTVVGAIITRATTGSFGLFDVFTPKRKELLNQMEQCCKKM